MGYSRQNVYEYMQTLKRKEAYEDQMSSSQDRLYSCRHCGAEYIAYPPDDVHSESDVNEISDSIAIPYQLTAATIASVVRLILPPQSEAEQDATKSRGLL